MTRADGRRANELRPVEADPAFLEQPHGMVLWTQGGTRVLCTASVVELSLIHISEPTRPY